MAYVMNLTHLKEWEWIDSNPFSRVKKPAEPRCQARFLESSHKNLYAIVVLAISTGMHQGGILSLKWKNIDLSRSRRVRTKPRIMSDERFRLSPPQKNLIGTF